MTEYTATCDYDSDDTIRAFTATGGVWVTTTQESDEVSIKLLPANARTFARGILALADEIDGGEAKPTPTPAVKAGDRVRVTETGLAHASVSVGDTLTVVYTYDDGSFDTTGGWLFEAHRIGNGLEVLPSDEPEPAPLKVGDRVVIVREYADRASRYDGAEAVLTEFNTDTTRFPYTVDIPDYGDCWVHEVRRADETTARVAPAPTTFAEPSRLALFNEAKGLARPGATDAQVMDLARFLAGE